MTQWKKAPVALLFAFFLCLNLINAQANLQSYDTAETGNVKSSELSAKPEGIQVDDLLLAVVCYTNEDDNDNDDDDEEEDEDDQEITTPEGWQVIAATSSIGKLHINTYYKIADSDDVNASEFTFQTYKSGKWTLGIMRISEMSIFPTLLPLLRKIPEITGIWKHYPSPLLQKTVWFCPFMDI